MRRNELLNLGGFLINKVIMIRKSRFFFFFLRTDKRTLAAFSCNPRLLFASLVSYCFIGTDVEFSLIGIKEKAYLIAIEHVLIVFAETCPILMLETYLLYMQCNSLLYSWSVFS